MENLKREEILEFLKMARPEFTEEDWKQGDPVTILTWAIPTYQAWKQNGFLNEATSK